jgi:hypothetical protein
MFEVEANSGTWIDLIDEQPHRRHCDFVGEVIGVSAGGSVAPQDIASSTSYSALVSPHRKFMIECPFRSRPSTSTM